jgi:hypothetical protein
MSETAKGGGYPERQRQKKKVIFAPFNRTDGKEISIVQVEDGVVLSLGKKTYFYEQDEVIEAGEGDYLMGVIMLGQIANRATAEDTENFTLRPVIEPLRPAED